MIHPVYHPKPFVMLSSYPRQGNLPLHDYHTHFADYLQLLAFVGNQKLSLSDPGPLDLFITNATHASYLHRVTREDRLVPTSQHKYTDLMIVDTLTTCLHQPDSPLFSTPIAPAPAPAYVPRPSNPYTRRPRPAPGRTTQSVPVNHLSLPAPVDDPFTTSPDFDTASTVYLAPPDATLASTAAELDTYDAPTDPATNELLHDYHVSIHQILQHPVLAVHAPCIVCKQPHRFDECPILNDTLFLRGHFIRFCQLLRRDETKTPSTVSPGAKSPAPVKLHPLGHAPTTPAAIPATPSPHPYHALYGQYQVPPPPDNAATIPDFPQGQH